MHRILGIAIALALLFPASARGQITKPIRYTWMVSSCPTWNCAAAALVMAGGDKHVIVLPTGQQENPWVVLKRVEEGALELDEKEAYSCETFDGVSSAASQFSTIGSCHGPMILNVPDGRTLIVSLKNCPAATTPQKRRAVD